MKRMGFVLVLGFLVALAICIVPIGNIAHADGNVIVIGSNDSDCSDGFCDSKTLQEALDSANPGATLILNGTFDFGVDQFVSLKKDVTIKGEFSLGLLSSYMPCFVASGRCGSVEMLSRSTSNGNKLSPWKSERTIRPA